MRKNAAVFEYLKNIIIADVIKSHRSISIISAASIFFSPKNTGDQLKLRSSCIIKRTSAAALPPSCSGGDSASRNKNSETNISIYKKLHTGAKTQSGGCNAG